MTAQLLCKIIELAFKWGGSVTISEQEMGILLSLINQNRKE